MMPVAAPKLRVLCRVDDIPDGGTRGVGPARGGVTGLFAVRRAGRVFVYVNACPHLGTPLEVAPDRFLSADGERIVCATHGAEFGIEDGVCRRGPCLGAGLEPVMMQIKDGIILVPDEAGL
jgi:nitrite reductase/ring-hydroxylating ferredoxin subunit